MRTYVDKNGGLTVEKHDSVAKPTATKAARTVVQENKKVSLADMVETAESYQLPMFTVNKTENGGSQCAFCGEKTAYDNRHVCINCWKKYHKEIFEQINSKVNAVDITIKTY